MLNNNGFIFVKSTINLDKVLPESMGVISKISLDNEEFTLLKQVVFLG